MPENTTLEIFNNIDQQIVEFQAASGLSCPAGCGKCCENPQVETTVSEVIPLALELFKSNQAEFYLAQAEAADLTGVCIFYQPDHLIPGNGRCGVYPWRPSLCRLFGFATVRNKYGELELAACKIHKRATPELLVNLDLQLAPNFSDYTMQLGNSESMPINQAIAIAIQKVGLLMEKAHPENL